MFADQKAKSLGLDALELSVSTHTGYSIEVRKQNLDALNYENNQHIGITVYKNKAKGHVSGCQLTKDAISRLVEKANDIAKLTQPDEAAGLAPKALLCTEVKDLSLYHPWDYSVEQATDLAKQIEQIALNTNQPVKQVEQAWVNYYKGKQYYFNSQMQHCLVEQKSNASIGLSVIAEKDEQMEQAYEYSVVRDPKDLKSAESLAHKAVEKAVSHLGARSLVNQKAPIILMPSVAKTIWSYLLSAISGRSIYQKTSFLVDHLNQQILPKGFTIHQNPFLPKAMASSCYDDDGVQTKAINFIEDGVLKSYILSQYSANRLGLETTGNCGGVFNVAPQGPSQSYQELIKTMHKGLIVTDFMGQGVDLATGSLSKAVNGFWVENGEIQFPVHQTSIAGNLKDIFQNIQLLSHDNIDHKSAILTGSVLINDVDISGQGL